ncbi:MULTISPECIES: efflux RND transporter periplasmic adaptor subunit [Streptomyces]|uniref:Peptidoglycan-binding protein n=1 Tax=Streptomyces salyersiae TaxID=3075530 RepID=A0ABU2RSK2_9ACTN|nr:peptidoglycan-binding protein [Streptomyces sp. DSM 41770]MDT0431806.1 peptidoglycan-binding protein [Streptomyces sp. DSM 41770]
MMVKIFGGRNAVERSTENRVGPARRKWVAAVVIGAVALTGAGLVASVVIKSPAQALADAGPPPRDVLTAKVERRVLEDSVIVRGSVTAAQSLEITPTVRGEDGAGAPVVTKLALRTGDTVKAGQVLFEVSGRPVFALKGKLPVYRDLKPESSGDDVAQLQRALGELGHATGGDRSGFFGAGTKAALTSFYASVGYEPVPAQADGGSAVAEAQNAVTAAERALEDLRDAAAPTGEQGAQKGADDGTAVSRQRAEERALADRDEARQTLADARAADGPMLPAGEVVYMEGFPARVDAVTAKVGTSVEGPVMTLSAGALVVQGHLQSYQKGLVRVGQKVEILSEVSGVTAAARVALVSSTPETGQDPSPNGDAGAAPAAPAAGEYRLEVRPDKPLDTQLVGQDVRLTIQAASTKGKALVVPISAISSAADGRTVVTVQEADGTQRRVRVRPGTTGDGYAEIVPQNGDALSVGDEVVTGTDGGTQR